MPFNECLLISISFQTVYSLDNSNILLLFSIYVPLSSVILCESAGALYWTGVNNRVNKAGHYDYAD